MAKKDFPAVTTYAVTIIDGDRLVVTVRVCHDLVIECHHPTSGYANPVRTIADRFN